jgi:hypothetical protein
VAILISAILNALQNDKLNSADGVESFCHTTSYQSQPQNEVERVLIMFDHVLGLFQIIFQGKLCSYRYPTICCTSNRRTANNSNRIA